ncbi:hypothetical protein RvY_13621-2 [Ramazzottius varieornatus]|uniref:Amino acid permease/ SLC12A domain-containing protein n=1 Tax=Ramazzottius varieornatus TaxID=947166 RepID=A0A1D1VNI6_RAMVA|nr:hypothetical protein RvY_13621-2 [Ramazzottius varieornatus]
MGASYLFAYSVFGEFVAFLIGWNDLLASFITLALTAQTLTHHLDVLSGGRLDSWMRKDLGVFPWDQSFAPDIVACFSLLLCGAAVCRCKNVRQLAPPKMYRQLLELSEILLTALLDHCCLPFCSSHAHHYCQ